MRFDNKVVVITGAGNGMGEAAARRFSAEGAIVVLADWAKEAVDKVAASLPKAGRWRCISTCPITSRLKK